jgi:RES domain-containing protein
VIVYRISSMGHARDLSGAGAGLYGGRWNAKGVNVVYAAQSRALAALEFYVNRSQTTDLVNLGLTSILLPEDASTRHIDLETLPEGWNSFPVPDETVEIGTAWAVSGETLVLCVPSAVMPRERNYIINPGHKDAARVTVAGVEDYAFDQRFVL